MTEKVGMTESQNDGVEDIKSKQKEKAGFESRLVFTSLVTNCSSRST
jgi:hypothetical protein